LFAAGAAALSVMTLCCDDWLLLVMISHVLCKQARLQALLSRDEVDRNDQITPRICDWSGG
jgi:hypothetical protein